MNRIEDRRRLPGRVRDSVAKWRSASDRDRDRRDEKTTIIIIIIKQQKKKIYMTWERSNINGNALIIYGCNLK